jgi:hypothetical protein
MVAEKYYSTNVNNEQLALIFVTAPHKVTSMKKKSSSYYIIYYIKLSVNNCNCVYTFALCYFLKLVQEAAII